jgi:delta(3,5)-delta(2,4)-dienoyl-CoA isomerase
MSVLDRLPVTRAVVLSAAGPHFYVGIELGRPRDPLTAACVGAADPTIAAEWLRHAILEMQEALTVIERWRKPIIAAVHGGGIDVIAAHD